MAAESWFLSLNPVSPMQKVRPSSNWAACSPLFISVFIVGIADEDTVSRVGGAVVVGVVVEEV